MADDQIVDMHNYIQSRKRRGKTATQVRSDLENRGYDRHAARAFVMMHWLEDCENPECPEAGNCDGKCADEKFGEYVSEKIGGGLD